MASLFGAFPFLIKLYADGGYQGPEFQSALKRFLARVVLEIIKRLGHAPRFAVLPKRWIVERTLAWLGRCGGVEIIAYLNRNYGSRRSDPDRAGERPQ